MGAQFHSNLRANYIFSATLRRAASSDRQPEISRLWRPKRFATAVFALSRLIQVARLRGALPALRQFDGALPAGFALGAAANGRRGEVVVKECVFGFGDLKKAFLCGCRKVVKLRRLRFRRIQFRQSRRAARLAGDEVFDFVQLTHPAHQIKAAGLISDEIGDMRRVEREGAAGLGVFFIIEDELFDGGKLPQPHAKKPHAIAELPPRLALQLGEVMHPVLVAGQKTLHRIPYHREGRIPAQPFEQRVGNLMILKA